MIDMALALGARRLEIAHVQYYAWALINRDALLPSRRQLDDATALVEAAQAKAEGRARHRLCRAGLSRRAAEILHERLGTAVPEHHAVRHGGAVPCRGDLAGHRLSIGAGQQPCRHLVPLRRLQPLPRHRLDARALSKLRPARDRLGRLPLPGLPADRATPAAPIRSAPCRPITAWSLPPCSGRRDAAGSCLSPVPPGQGAGRLRTLLDQETSGELFGPFCPWGRRDRRGCAPVPEADRRHARARVGQRAGDPGGASRRAQFRH